MGRGEQRHPSSEFQHRTGHSPPRLLSPETSDLAPAGFGQQVRDATDRRRIKTQTVLPCAETVPMLLWALLASGQIQMRKVDGWETLSQPIEPMPLDLAA